jgi:WD40 repeat protein
LGYSDRDTGRLPIRYGFRHSTNPEIFPPIFVRCLSTRGVVLHLENTGILRTWSIESKTIVDRKILPDNYVYGADISNDGTLLCVSSSREVAVYDIRADPSLVRSFADETFSATAVHFTPDGKGLLIVSRDGVGSLWNLETVACDEWLRPVS